MLYICLRGSHGSLDKDAAELEKLLGASIASSTKRKYDGLWSRWISYAAGHRMPTRPASGINVALFLANLAQKKKKTVCVAAAAAISWNHTSHGLASPCSEVIVKSALAGARRSFASPVRRTEPFSLELLLRVVLGLPRPLSTSDLQFYFYIVIAFFGFFRYNDMKRLLIRDFTRQGPNLLVTLSSSKTDKFRAGAGVYLAANKNDVALCPVAVSSAFFSMLKTSGHGDATPVLVSLAKRGKLISASTLTRRLRSTLAPLVEDAQRFTLHSLRSGGATAAATANVSRALIATHGRWQSECVNQYIRLNDETRFSVSRAIAAQSSRA